MRELRTRYEDDPDSRGVTADEIIGRLRAGSMWQWVLLTW
jgi:hypothetical protein